MLPTLLLLIQLATAQEQGTRVDYLPAEPWPVGQRLFVAGHEVNLRAAASTDAPVVRELDLGAPAAVKARAVARPMPLVAPVMTTTWS